MCWCIQNPNRDNHIVTNKACSCSSGTRNRPTPGWQEVHTTRDGCVAVLYFIAPGNGCLAAGRHVLYRGCSPLKTAVWLSGRLILYSSGWRLSGCWLLAVLTNDNILSQHKYKLTHTCLSVGASLTVLKSSHLLFVAETMFGHNHFKNVSGFQFVVTYCETMVD